MKGLQKTFYVVQVNKYTRTLNSRKYHSQVARDHLMTIGSLFSDPGIAQAAFAHLASSHLHFVFTCLVLLGKERCHVRHYVSVATTAVLRQPALRQ